MTDPLSLALPAEGNVRSLRLAAICVGGAAICGILPFVENAALYLVVLALGVAVIGPVWFDWAKGRLDYFEPVHSIGFVHFLFFGLGAIWTVNNPSRVAYDLHLVPFIPVAALYALFGYLAFLVGYYGPWRLSRPAPARGEWLSGTLFMIVAGTAGLAGLMSVGWWDVASRRGLALPIWVATLSQLWPLFLFAWALAWATLFSGRATRAQRWIIFGGFIPSVLVAGFYTFSDKSMAITLIAVPIVARWYMRRKIPWIFLLVLLLITIFVLFPIYNAFHWFDAGMSRTARVGMAYDTVRNWDSDSYWMFSLGSFKSRLAMINSTAIVIRDTPRWVPFARGETIFMPAVSMFIPRALWPEKPVQQTGREFGRKFRITNVFNRETHIGSTIAGELYWNFGLLGILVGMALFGAMVRYLYRRYAAPGSGAVQLAVHVLLLVTWVHFIGGSIAIALVAIFRLMLVLEALRWLGRHYGFLAVDEPG